MQNKLIIVRIENSGRNFLFVIYYYTEVVELVDPSYVTYNMQIYLIYFLELKRNLDDKLYGQHLAINTIINHLKGQAIGQQQKAIAFSFHGGTGTGKTYTSRIIVETLYKKGLNSKYVHLISATRDFNHASNVHYYKVYNGYVYIIMYMCMNLFHIKFLHSKQYCHFLKICYRV